MCMVFFLEICNVVFFGGNNLYRVRVFLKFLEVVNWIICKVGKKINK